MLSPLRFRIGEFWRLHSRGVLYLKHMIIVSCQPLIADRVQATIMSCKHDNHFSTDTLFIAFIIARHCLICNSSISERTSIASDNSSEFSSFFPYIMKSTDTPSTIARLSNVCVLKSPPFQSQIMPVCLYPLYELTHPVIIPFPFSCQQFVILSHSPFAYLCFTAHKSSLPPLETNKSDYPYSTKRRTRKPVS